MDQASGENLQRTTVRKNGCFCLRASDENLAVRTKRAPTACASPFTAGRCERSDALDKARLVRAPFTGRFGAGIRKL
ncbi:MAG: hypothetical protein C4334_04115 [Pyrinomonas sp.]